MVGARFAQGKGGRPGDVGSFQKLAGEGQVLLVSPALWCDPDLDFSRARPILALGPSRLCGCLRQNV